MEKSPKFPPQTEVEQQVLGEQQLGLGEFPSRAGEGGRMEQSPAGFQQLGEHLVHRDQSCTFDLGSPSKAEGKALKGKGKDLKKSKGKGF